MSGNKRHPALTRILITACLIGTAACEQATSPGTSTLDAPAALADYQALQQMFASQGFVGVQALAGRTPMSSRASLESMRLLPELGNGRTGRDWAVELFREAGTPTLTKTIISPRHLGRTFVYNRTLDQYVVDSTRSGAPANGVRFIVYEVGPDGKPIPTAEIGRADLIDEGANTGEAIALRLVAVTRGVTTLDYRTRVDVNESGGTIAVSGFAAEGSNRLDFTVGLKGRTSASGTIIDADFDFAVKPRNFSIAGTARDIQDERDGEGRISITARHQENTLTLTVNGQGGTLDGRITWNSQPFVTISGPLSAPIFKGPTGAPVTFEEALVVRNVLRMTDDAFDLLEELVEPVEDLVLLGGLL